MKRKFSKGVGIGLALVLTLAVVAGFGASVAASPDETLNEWYTFGYPAEGEDGDWFYSPDISGMREITEAINSDLYVYALIGRTDEILKSEKSEDGGRTWAITGYSDPDDGVEGGQVFDMVCSSIDEDIVYATDGCYVYKTDDGGDTWGFVGKDSIETALVGECGEDVCCDGNERVITSLDVTYDDDDNPFVFIGTRAHSDCNGGDVEGDVLYIGEAGYPANWTSLNLDCFHGGGYDALSVGCAPDWADSKETYVVVSDGSDTWVVYTKGTVCGWYEFAELEWDCLYSFPSIFASRIGFPDDWEDTETLFVGVVDCNYCGSGNGGDVYMATDGSAIDMNVAGIVTGCVGEQPVDIISLDVMGDTEEAQLIAGAFCDTNVYYSTDGGWSWDESAKDPTGEDETYVLWYEDTALAATWGCESAISMACTSDNVEDVGEAWNQISLIATDIDMVRWLGFSPGYKCEGSETMFMLTSCDDCCRVGTNSLFRYDDTYWERVFLNETYDVEATPWWQVEVSPDFNTTNCVYLANRAFEIFRTTDAGCSWDALTFPCAPRPTLWAMVVIDEDTVVAGVEDNGTPEVWKTTRHGARPWVEYDLPDGAGEPNLFALEPRYEDPGSILLGDDMSQVFISEDGGETWDLVGDCVDVLTNASDTYVAFDPGYATNNFIYAAAGDTIARCIIDPDADWADQEWELLCNELYVADGIQVTGDTALYVTDGNNADYNDLIDEGGVLRSLNPDAEDADDVVFERIGPGLVESETELDNLWLTCDTSDDGCAENVLWSLEQIWANVENVWVYEDTLAQPVVLDMPVDEQKLATTDKATLSWNELCGADCYEVSLYAYCAECPDQKLAVDLSDLTAMDCCSVDTVACGPELECPDDVCTEDICIVVDELDPGTKYYWQVRVCQGKPTLSKWSAERSFTTALMAVPFADLCSPDCGAQDIILTPNFAWGAVSGATGYEVELATTETFTVGVVKGTTTVNAWVCPTTLEYATTYYWRVRADKDGIYSDWTYCMFTTMAEPVPPTPPVVVEQVPPSAPPVINIPPATMITPTWIYAIIGVGAALAIVVIVLIVRTRRPL